jgi:hypothetical protein
MHEEKKQWKFPEGTTVGEVVWIYGMVFGGLAPVSILLYGKQKMDGSVVLDQDAMLRGVEEIAAVIYQRAEKKAGEANS